MKRLRANAAILVAAFALLPARVAPAQDAVSRLRSEESEPVSETERVVVTGSNIPTADAVGSNPVLVVDREAISRSGHRTTEELLVNLPLANAQNVPPVNNANLHTPGASTIALRGFDPRPTLILLDGRRLATYPFANGTITFVDVNSIPQAAIDSIEILKDGASVTYGADAVAGVVNIKLRHGYRGAEATVQYGSTCSVAQPSLWAATTSSIATRREPTDSATTRTNYPAFFIIRPDASSISS